MADVAARASVTSNGWVKGAGTMRVYVAGTLAATFDDASNDLVLPTNGLTITAGGATVTAGGVTVTAGNVVVTASDVRVTAGNYRSGPVNSFGTTEPTQSVVLEAGTAPAGAITTSSGIFASSTVLQKIIANGTVSNVG